MVRDEWGPGRSRKATEESSAACKETKRTGSERESQLATGSRCPGGTLGSATVSSERAFANLPDSLAMGLPTTLHNGGRRGGDSRRAVMPHRFRQW